MFYKNCLGKAEWKVGYAEVSHLLGQQEIGPNCSSVWLFQQANAPEPSVLQMGAQTHNVDGKLGYKYSGFVFFFLVLFPEVFKDIIFVLMQDENFDIFSWNCVPVL